MNTVEIAATIVGIFFAIGIVVGALGVIALSAIHPGGKDHGHPPPGELRQARSEELPQDEEPGGRPWWDDRG